MRAEAMVFDRFWGKSMRELTQIDHREMREFAREYRDLLYEMPFQVPEDIIFLVRCVAILSGMCTGLYEDFNLFEGLRPFAQKLLAEEDSAWLDVLLEQLGEQARALSRLPKKLDNALALIERGQLKVIADVTPELESQIKGLTKSINRLIWVFLFGVLFLAGTFLYVRGYEPVAIFVYGMSAIVLIRMVFM
jgi:predicted unusual protein kinase regulating ubiquinone biosynthesis (AarF/ABC1/UbiB family)